MLPNTSWFDNWLMSLGWPEIIMVVVILVCLVFMLCGGQEAVGGALGRRRGRQADERAVYIRAQGYGPNGPHRFGK